MSEEKKTVELKDKELEKVSGGQVSACANYDNGRLGILQYGDPCAGCKYWAYSAGKHYCIFEDSFKPDTPFESEFPEPDWGEPLK